MQDLSLFYKEAQRRKSLFIKPENPFDDFIITTGKRLVDRNIELDDIKSFFNIQFGNDKLSLKYKQAVDLLKFQFLIGGHDFVELSHLKWTDIKNNRITFHRFKNKHRGGGMLIDNMLHPMALSIIDMYGTKDHKRIFSFIPENILNDFTYNRYLRSVISNRLESITEINKLSFKIRTKYIRYSFRTIGGNLMINQMVLEKIMGHSNSSISMGYQGVTPYEIQDAEHLKIIEAVFGND